MPPSDFAKADVDQIVDQLTTDEAISLIGGVGFWKTHAIERLGIPAIKVSDGPNGIRGNHFMMGTPAKCLPSSTALGATFDPQLVEEVGLKLLAPEAKLRAASLVLAPTANIQRNPLGGRSFESFSEDPYLSGIIAASYINGVQKGGIGATIKHFVGNDKENDRQGYDSIMSERVLREIYLLPFMLAQKYAQPWAIMTAYNRVNGIHVCEDPFLLKKILREEWGFNGMVMSDWFGTYSVDIGINAGLDLEMPGTNKWRTLDFVNRSIQARKLTARAIKERAKVVLECVKKCAEGAPEILDGDGLERTLESNEDKQLMRKIAAQSIVLLKNENHVLPIQPQVAAGKIKKIAIVGGNAKSQVLSGGGSAALKPSYFISPYDGIVNALEGTGVQISFAEGARTYMSLPTLENDLLTPDAAQRPGWLGTWYNHVSDDSLVPLDAGVPVVTQYLDETRIFVSTSTPPGITTKRWTLRLRGLLRPRERDERFEFGLTAAGRAKLYIDGQLVIDNWTRQRRGDSFFASGSKEETGVFELKAGVKHEVFVDYINVRGPADGDEDEALMDSNPGVRLGGAPVQDPDSLIADAVAIAAQADLVIAVVGLNADWETEGYDRTTLALPGRTDELISKVRAVNERVVVVTQAGSAITLPWIDEIPALVHAWYLGNATGAAIADVLLGTVNPSGKLSLTFPRREEDIPSHGHFHSEDGKVRYAEGLFVGYKHYVHRSIEPLFPFGFGLSYTTFGLSNLSLSSPSIDHGARSFSLAASVTLTNTGARPGSQAVQLYIRHPATSTLTHPPLRLAAFAKVRDLAPGASTVVRLALDRLAVSFWDERFGVWSVEKGVWEVRVGESVGDVVDGEDKKGLKATFEIAKGFEWTGI